MKIATIIGARPQFIKASSVSRRIKKINTFSEIIIHTGQHFEWNMSDVFFEEMGIPNADYNLDINNVNHTLMINKMHDSLKPILLKEKIKGIIVYGDTNSTLAGSLAASDMGIPIFHVEAGLRSFDRAMLEEKNRIITDHLSDLLFCPTPNSVKNLSNENISKGVFYTGDVMYDAFLDFSKRNLKSEMNNTKKYILATIHRRENIKSHKNLSNIFSSLDEINKKIKVVMPIHPHTRKKIEEKKIKSKISFIKPLGYFQMMSLLQKSEAVITDSGGLQKESFFAKKKCIIVRKNTEWLELLENGSSIISEPKHILESFNKILVSKPKFSSSIFGNGNANKLIVETIVKYLK